jgi:hypothetical protein
MKKCLYSILLVLLLICGSCSHSTDYGSRMTSLFDALNRHDVSTAIAYFAEDVQYIMDDGTTISGKPALRKLIQWDSTLATTLEVGGISTIGDTVIVDTLVESSEWGRLMGIPGMHSAPGSKFVFENGLIKRVEYSASLPEDGWKFRNRMTAFLNWLAIVHRERMNEVKNRTFFQFNAERASDLMALAEEWREWRSARGMVN